MSRQYLNSSVRRVQGLVIRSIRAHRRYTIATVGLLMALSAPLAATSVGRAASLLRSTSASSTTTSIPAIASADAHFNAPGDIEVDLALTQTRPDCGTAPNGQTCLRYAIRIDEQAADVGYGLIPDSDVQVSGSTVTLTVDTSSLSGFHHPHGSGGPISLSWSAASATSSYSLATVQGSILNYILPVASTHGTILKSS